MRSQESVKQKQNQTIDEKLTDTSQLGNYEIVPTIDQLIAEQNDRAKESIIQARLVQVQTQMGDSSKFILSKQSALNHQLLYKILQNQKLPTAIPALQNIVDDMLDSFSHQSWSDFYGLFGYRLFFGHTTIMGIKQRAVKKTFYNTETKKNDDQILVLEEFYKEAKLMFKEKVKSRVINDLQIEFSSLDFEDDKPYSGGISLNFKTSLDEKNDTFKFSTSLEKMDHDNVYLRIYQMFNTLTDRRKYDKCSHFGLSKLNREDLILSSVSLENITNAGKLFQEICDIFGNSEEISIYFDEKDLAAPGSKVKELFERYFLQAYSFESGYQMGQLKIVIDKVSQSVRLEFKTLLEDENDKKEFAPVIISIADMSKVKEVKDILEGLKLTKFVISSDPVLHDSRLILPRVENIITNFVADSIKFMITDTQPLTENEFYVFCKSLMMQNGSSQIAHKSFVSAHPIYRSLIDSICYITDKLGYKDSEKLKTEIFPIVQEILSGNFNQVPVKIYAIQDETTSAIANSVSRAIVLTVFPFLEFIRNNDIEFRSKKISEALEGYIASPQRHASPESLYNKSHILKTDTTLARGLFALLQTLSEKNSIGTTREIPIPLQPNFEPKLQNPVAQSVETPSPNLNVQRYLRKTSHK